MGVLGLFFSTTKNTYGWAKEWVGGWVGWVILQENDEPLIWAVKVFHHELVDVFFSFFRHEVGCI